MEAWMAFVSIIAIVAIVLVSGGLIAFICHMIIGAFDKDRKVETKKEVVDYVDYKQLEDAKTEAKDDKNEYDFEAINEAKAEQEKEMLAQDKDIDVFKLEALEINGDEDLDALEARLKAENEKIEETIDESNVVAEENEETFDLDSLLDEISTDVIEEEKENVEAPALVEMDESLQNYHIDDYLNQTEEETVEEVETENNEDEISDDSKEEIIEEDDEEDDDEGEGEDGEEIVPELVEEIEENEEVEEKEEQDEQAKEIESLKAQLAELNKQLEAARNANVAVVAIDMTEEECVSRLEVLEERLRNAKKEYKINMKEYKPLKKVMSDLEKYQTKLRRKETIVAKKKVSLYGVNNYVDIDKEKAEKLANELELLDGLRLSVQHCEEVISANKDRYPILEHTNKILEDQIAHIEADIETTNATLAKIREDKE